MKYLSRILLITFVFVFSATYSHAESWRDKTELLIYSPRYFGPNAFPIPEMRDGQVSERYEVEVRGEYHYYTGDKTWDIVGRAQPDQELTLEFNRERCVWEFQGAETELWKLPPDPLLEAVAKMLSPEQPEWSGTPTELLERLSGVSIQANILTRKLNVSADRLYNDYGIRYESKRTHEGRVVKLTLENSGT